MRLAVRQVRWADQTLSEAHRRKALQMPTLWAKLLPIRPLGPSHQEACVKFAFTSAIVRAGVGGTGVKFQFSVNSKMQSALYIRDLVTALRFTLSEWTMPYYLLISGKRGGVESVNKYFETIVLAEMILLYFMGMLLLWFGKCVILMSDEELLNSVNWFLCVSNVCIIQYNVWNEMLYLQDTCKCLSFGNTLSVINFLSLFCNLTYLLV